MNSSIFVILLALFFFVHHSQALLQHHFNNKTDREALLSFKSQVISDPNGILDTWSPNISFCYWHGVLCNPTKNRVTGLTLGSLSLTGTITPHITNLSFIHLLNLQNNRFQGTIPIDFGKLFRLETLNLSANNIHGIIPSSLSRCSRLRIIDLSKNHLEGTMPSELGNLRKLQDLRFSENNLTGSIPSSFGNLSSLNNLNLKYNNLQGPIPAELGRLSFLLQLQLGVNHISGEIPSSLFNVSSLIQMKLAGNQISGSLPSNLFTVLPNLTTLFVGGNLFRGHIPPSLSNATKLQDLDLSINQLTGQVPLLWNLPSLRLFNLEFNQLISNGEQGLDFITSLTNSTLLEVFSVVDNQLSGQLPSSIGNLSSQLSFLSMGFNNFEGKIPEGVGNLGGLIFFSIISNSFTGNIPSAIGNLQKLQALYLHMNLLTGSIPESLGNLSQLLELLLRRNNLTDKIPSSLINCQHLLVLDLSINSLNGNIPKEIFSFPNLGIRFDISWNCLTGSLPSEIGTLKMVQILGISNNRLSGAIPSTIAACTNLLHLDLSRNSFQGLIPTSLVNLKGIEYIDLSSNNLSGPIPSLDTLRYLQLLNLSANDLRGGVPQRGIFLNTSVVFLNGNPKLCGGILQLGLPNCIATETQSRRSKRMLIAGIVGGLSAICILIVLSFFLILFIKRKQQQKTTTVADVISFEGPHRLYSYYDLKFATNNYSSENLIGGGSFGSVYKGVMRDGTLAAIKVFDMEQHGASKSFLVECEAFRNIRHRNLVKILSACSTTTFKALVLQFMPNGSLERWLHYKGEDGREGLSLKQRLEIAINVAAAMEYLHHGCETPVVHCDLKPSNVLLHQDMTAHVADFGLARMLHGSASNRPLSSTIGLKGSVGYIAPEYGFGGGISTKGDVYSYGILLLEIFTGKKPTEEMFSGELNLQKWVGAALPNQVVEIMDDEVAEHCTISRVDHIISLIKMGLSCASEIPGQRPNMVDVCAMINRTKGILFTGST